MEVTVCFNVVKSMNELVMNAKHVIIKQSDQ